MPSTAQRAAARRNVKMAAAAARDERSIAKMPKATRSALGRQGVAIAARNRRGSSSPHTRQELDDEARRKNVPGRSKMGRAELARVLGHS